MSVVTKFTAWTTPRIVAVGVASWMRIRDLRLAHMWAIALALTLVAPHFLEVQDTPSTVLSPLQTEFIPLGPDIHAPQPLPAQYLTVRSLRKHTSLSVTPVAVAILPTRDHHSQCVLARPVHQRAAYATRASRAPPRV
jgi:hypothetical protein